MNQTLDFSSILHQCKQEKQIQGISGSLDWQNFEWVLGVGARQAIRGYFFNLHQVPFLPLTQNKLMDVEISGELSKDEFGIELRRKSS